LSLNLTDAISLVEKMASNRAFQPCKRGGDIHQLKEANILTTKVDLLIKRLEDQMGEKKEVMHIHDSRMTCEECGDTRHSGSNCPKLQEDVNYINNNNNYRPQ
jgi:hypothetical protein